MCTMKETLLSLLWLPSAFCSSQLSLWPPSEQNVYKYQQKPPNWVFPEDCSSVLQNFSAQLNQTQRISLVPNPSPRPQDAEFKPPYTITNGTCTLRIGVTGNMGQGWNITVTKDVVWRPALNLMIALFPGSYHPWQTGHIEWKISPPSAAYRSVVLGLSPSPPG